MRGKRENIHTYTVRIWREGQIVKEIGPLTKAEASKTWNAWNDVNDCGPELLVDGKHVPWAKANKTLKRKAGIGRMVG